MKQEVILAQVTAEDNALSFSYQLVKVAVHQGSFIVAFFWQCSAIQSTAMTICYSSKFKAHSSAPAFCADLERKNIKS